MLWHMEGMVQNIGQEELERIATYILETRLAPAIEKMIRKNEMRMKELSLIERVVKVEEELRALREIESSRFEAIEKRFEALQREMNARFEAMDKRFEALQREMNARFEAMDKRFEALQREMNARFEAMDRRLSFLQWFIGIGFSVLTILFTLFRFYPYPR